MPGTERSIVLAMVILISVFITDSEGTCRGGVSTEENLPGKAS